VIRGAHFLLYSDDPEADRAFFRDVLGFPSVDVGHGWLIFKLPPAEMAVHPSEGDSGPRQGGAAIAGSVLYLLCDNLQETMAALRAHGVDCAAPQKAGWGTSTTVPLPSGARIGLYEPRHELAIDLSL
jgi:catechol 2,3-dioxygenase-like lactoylglutathione lyase family enzyme